MCVCSLGVTYQSIRTWSKEYGIGRIGDDGRWRIDKSKLDQVIATRDQIAELQDSLKRLG